MTQQAINEHDQGQRFMRLFLKHQQRMYGLIYSLTPNWADADDIMQNTSSVMWAKFSDFEPGTDFAAWALRIARLQVMAYLKANRRQRAGFSMETLEAVADHATKAAAELDDRRCALEHCVGKLSPRDQMILKLRYEQDGAVKSVADRIDRSADAVYKALNRIHHTLLLCIRRTLTSMEGRS